MIPKFLEELLFFKGTRVSIKSLFEYLERDYALAEFLECFRAGGGCGWFFLFFATLWQFMCRKKR
jgi:hypothetical protein